MWHETDPMRERVRFVAAVDAGHESFSALCERFGVSRKTGYKWRNRYVLEGVDGLKDRSRSAQRRPNQTSIEVDELVIGARETHPTWGPKKLKVFLAERHPEIVIPAPSTIGRILRDAGLVESRQRRRRRLPPSKPVVQAEQPNDVWCLDFKGQFKTLDGQYCYPLTVTDYVSRYILMCDGLTSTRFDTAFLSMSRLFDEYGVPSCILTDNGSPFRTTNGLCGLSRLSVFWLQMGIQPIRIQPGHPEQNGRHERMHRTLKADTTKPPARDLAGQCARFTSWRRVFNEERPHEALAMKTPATVYRSGPAARIEQHDYPAPYETRRVKSRGEINFKGERIFLSEVLSRQTIGMQEIEDGLWTIEYGPWLLATLDERTGKITEAGPDPVRTRGLETVTHVPG